jgi:hypothetical protein
MIDPKSRDRALLNSNFFTAADYANMQTGTASAAGTVAGQIAAGKKVVCMDSANDAHFVTLPAVPVVGQVIRIINWDSAQDFRVQPYTATHTINNTAYIYFDFNAPIITNTTKNYATVAGINNIRSVNNFSVYPNPFREELSISRNESSKAILEIYNLLGEQILQKEIQDKKTVLSTQTWPAGIYIVKMIGDKDVVTQRVVKN